MSNIMNYKNTFDYNLIKNKYKLKLKDSAL